MVNSLSIGDGAKQREATKKEAKVRFDREMGDFFFIPSGCKVTQGRITKDQTVLCKW